MSNSGRLSIPILSSAKVKELLSIELLIEPELAIRAISRVHSAPIQRLHNINTSLVEMIERKNSVGYIRKNIEFHKTIYLRVQAPSMLALLEMVWSQLGPAFKVCFDTNRKSLKTSIHNDILLELRSGNYLNLADSIREDINNNSQVPMI